ncbi:MAG: glycosyltransferase [Casimicrobiaceae bacterium]
MISVVICSIDPGKFAAVSASCARAFAAEAYEIVGIHDAASLCEGYNRGLACAKGELVVFMHDDVEILTTDLGRVLERHLATFDVVGIAGTDALRGMNWGGGGICHAYGAVAGVIEDGYVLQLFGARDAIMPNIVALDGVFIAARREVAEAVRFDAATFDGWHGYDVDFTFRCHRAGYRLAACLDIRLIHTGRGRVDAAWLRYDKRFADKHAGLLEGPPGTWLDVRKRVTSREALIEAWEPAALTALTTDVRRRAGA